MDAHAKLFNRKKNKVKDKCLSRYPCDIFLHNALTYLKIDNATECMKRAYTEICYAIFKSGGTLSADEAETFNNFLNDITKSE